MATEPQQHIELVKKVQTGDQEAFGGLYDIFSKKIYSYIISKTSNPDRADDILQEVFIKAWKGIPNLALDGLNFNAWLYKVASNTINDYFRKQYRSPQTISLDPEIDIPSQDTTARSGNNIDHSLLMEHLSELPPDYQEVIELRYVQELSIKETADVMKRTSVAVRVLQHRAISKLKQIAKNLEID